MDSNEKYVSVSLPVEYWRNLHAMLDFEFTNTAKALCLVREQKNLHLCDFYINKISFISICMDEINASLMYGNKDLQVNAAL